VVYSVMGINTSCKYFLTTMASS